MSAIKFLNIDLDLESTDDLSPVVHEFERSCSIMRNEVVDGIHYVSFETGCTEENQILSEYEKAIDGLSSTAKILFKKCRNINFDFGYESGTEPNSFHSPINQRSVKVISRLGGSIVITIYPISK